ncbi:HAD family hydrolase [Solitalea lacus]|uniref:HAD family hydrolase n=1 Tax=Solitalea lacus TaxID=2911172 RepID=UPI001EDB3F79|nr:HAD family hydrolase [Solitalea lacus]UKJ08165.1 HAD hydrolase-like protein [Solitalea lacus]
MGIKLVVFDIAGTTLHDESNVAICLQEALAAHEVNVSIEEVNVVMGYAKPFAITELLKLKNDSRCINVTFIDEVHADFVSRMINHYKYNDAIKEKPYATEIFSLLRQNGIKVALDTGFDRQITDVILERMNWKSSTLIDVTLCSDEVRYGRPYPYMIFKAMEATGIASTQEVAKVGDTLSDLEEGANAACRYVIGVTSGAYSADELKEGPYTHLVESLKELETIFSLK